ncbi:MAG TPA: long-chain fatty acid--CoA ligase [Terriglobales bacterium]|nr:long-chain fatty acid--CoA ligase [Terriglobales bacterium]
MALQTINDLFFSVVDRNSERVMLSRQSGEWKPISSQEIYRNVMGVASALEKWGMKKGDRVAILSENRPEWTIAEFATAVVGGVVVPIYPTQTSEQISYMLRDSGARLIFVSTLDQMKKVREIQDQTALEKSVAMDYLGVNESHPMGRLMQEGPTARDIERDARAKQINGADDLETIIYTSGTTGTPKGAMLTHGNLTSNLQCSLQGTEIGPTDTYISFLPLSHITARHVDYVMLHHGVVVAYCPMIDDLPRTLQEIRPTIMVGVPRVYEKMKAQVQKKAATGLKHVIYKWGLKVGCAHRKEILSDRQPTDWDWRLANKLLYRKLRAAIGGRVKLFISGGAPLGRELGEWYADMGIRIDEGYGLTETSPVIAVNTPNAHKLGTVGIPLSNVEVRIAADGEVLVKGPSIFKGYWNLPDETRNAFDGEWFKTGDIGNIDSEGFLSITDRKKDLIKTSGGKFIAPQPIESMLKSYPLIAEAALLGDRRKFPAVVICPNFPALEEWASSKGLTFANREDLVSKPEVRTLYDGIVAGVNAELAQFEKLKKVLLIPEEFTIASGFLTPTMKLRRRVLEERYRAQIEQLYSEPASKEEVVRTS